MLTSIDPGSRRYTMALNNYTNAAELQSDLSYLEAQLPGELCFDFRHMAAAVTQETREEYLPGSFGYQPTRQLAEVASALIELAGRTPKFAHRLTALLPRCATRVGSYLAGMRLDSLLRDCAVTVRTQDAINPEFGEDDVTRKSLIPLTRVPVTHTGPDFRVVAALRQHIEEVFAESLPGESLLVQRFTGIISEAVDNMIEYGEGGLVAGLYYPRIGEVEITLINQCGGFGGATPEEQLKELVGACTRRRLTGGNGIAELSRLCLCCFGTLWLVNGSAGLRFLPDGNITADVERTGLAADGASVTVLLQLLPAASVARNPTMRAFEEVLRGSLDAFSQVGSRL